MAPSVSVIVPTYNREQVVSDTIRSVLAQTCSDFEIIVVDDGSTDGTVKAIKDFGDSRIRVYQQANAGPGAARNRGIAEAVGEYLKFLDSDDLITPLSLEQQLEVMRKSGAAFGYGPWIHCRFDDLESIEVSKNVMQQHPLPKHRSALDALMQSWTVIVQASLFVTERVRKCKGFRTDMINYEDMELIFRYLAKTPSVCFAEDSLTLYRDHALGRLTGESVGASKRLADRRALANSMYEVVQKEGLKITPYSRLSLGFDRALQQSAWHRLFKRVERLRTSIRRRILGTSWHPDYRVASITENQVDAIKNLGFARVSVQ